MLKYLTVFLFLFIGCTSTLQVDNKPVERLPLNIVEPPALSLDAVKISVVTDKNASAVFLSMKNSKQNPVLFGLSSASYKALSLNLEKIKNYILLEKEILQQYKSYYETPSK